MHTARCDHCGVKFNGQAWEFAPSTNRGSSRLSGLPRWFIVVIVVLIVLAFLAGTALPEDAYRRRGPIVNIAADGLVECLVPPFRIDDTHSKRELIKAFQSTVDRYADAHVPYLFFNVCYQRAAYRSRVWDCYWDVDDPESSVTGWPRYYWLVHKKGVDPFRICLARCREKGISPWLSVRMNDTHYIDDSTRTSTLWQNHPELRRVHDKQWYCGFDFAHRRVRDHYLALVEELLERYDCDGVELDWMRFPHYFQPGKEEQGCKYLNEFMQQVHRLAEGATSRRGHRVRIAARIPAVPRFARGLGMDGVAWARRGWIDMLILSPEWRPSDTDIPIEQWRQQIGSAANRVLLAAAADLWLQGMPGGKLMSDDLETQRGFTAAMLDRGADLIYLFNHFNMNDFRRTVKTPDSQTGVRDESRALLRAAGRLEAALKDARRHVVTFHDPAAPGMPNPKQLPAVITQQHAGMFRIYAGPKPSSGRVIIRIGLDHLPAVAAAKLTVRLNGAACTPTEDLARLISSAPIPQDRQRVFQLADVAYRMMQFETRPSAMERGQNTIEISLQHGERQRIIWLEIHVESMR